MAKYTNHRQIWEEHCGEIPIDEFGHSYHIHHKDGNIENNSISNLLCISAKDHYNLHLKQGDFGAALLISRNFVEISPEKRSELISKSNSIRWKNYSKSKRQEITTKNVESNKSTWSCPNLRKRTGKRISESHSNRSIEDKSIEGMKKSKSIKIAWASGNFAKQEIHMRTLVTCPYCNKSGQKAAMARHHFERCKHNE